MPWAIAKPSPEPPVERLRDFSPPWGHAARPMYPFARGQILQLLEIIEQRLNELERRQRSLRTRQAPDAAELHEREE